MDWNKILKERTPYKSAISLLTSSSDPDPNSEAFQEFELIFSTIAEMKSWSYEKLRIVASVIEDYATCEELNDGTDIVLERLHNFRFLDDGRVCFNNEISNSGE